MLFQPEWLLSIMEIVSITAQKMKFSITYIFSKCDQIRRKLRIWSHVLKKSIMKNFNFLCSACSYMKILTLSWRRPLSYRNQSLICSASQWTGLYMITTSVMKQLKSSANFKNVFYKNILKSTSGCFYFMTTSNV